MMSEIPLLFKVYPDLRDKIPWMRLTNLPTKVEKLNLLGEYLGINNLWIKRDDQSALLYGGNKPRKLEFVLAEAREREADEIVTMGGIGSNHCLATTIYAQDKGIKPVLFLFHQPLTEHVKKNLSLFHYFGARLNLVPSALSAYWSCLTYCLKRKKAYLLPPGGSSILGSLGYVNAAFELREQIKKKEMPPPKYIFVTCGTCGTLAGLEVGARLSGLKTKLVGVRVVDKVIVNRITLKVLTNKIMKYLGKRCKDIPGVYPVRKSRPGGSSEQSSGVNFNLGDFTLLHNYFGGEYGRVTSEGERILKLIKEKEGIQLDTTYTAKTFAGLVDFMKINRKGTVLFWNTFNSVDLSKAINSVNYKELPDKFHKFFTR